MPSTEIGALMRYADDLADQRIIPIAACTVLSRLAYRYRAYGTDTACVGLDEIAGLGMAKGTVIKLLRALERARLIAKEKWGVPVDGHWRQMPNRYRLRTVEEAKALAIADAEYWEEDAAYVRVQIALEDSHEIVSVTPSESNSCTVLPAIADSSLPLSTVSKEGAHECELPAVAAPLSEPSALGNPRADADGGAVEGALPEPWRPSPERLGGGIPGGDGRPAMEALRAAAPIRETGGDRPAAGGQTPNPLRARGLLGIDLLIARRKAFETGLQPYSTRMTIDRRQSLTNVRQTAPARGDGASGSDGIRPPHSSFGTRDH